MAASVNAKNRLCAIVILANFDSKQNGTENAS